MLFNIRQKSPSEACRKTSRNSNFVSIQSSQLFDSKQNLADSPPFSVTGGSWRKSPVRINWIWVSWVRSGQKKFFFENAQSNFQKSYTCIWSIFRSTKNFCNAPLLGYERYPKFIVTCMKNVLNFSGQSIKIAAQKAYMSMQKMFLVIYPSCKTFKLTSKNDLYKFRIF